MNNLKIEVIGSGCRKCKSLFELTQEVVRELNINANVLYNTDINKIVAMGLMSSPVLTIDNKPVLVGMLPDKDRLKENNKKWITKNKEKYKNTKNKYKKEKYKNDVLFCLSQNLISSISFYLRKNGFTKKHRTFVLFLHPTQ